MTNIAARVIDWRTQFAALDPYLNGLGGVIQIRLGSDSPGSAFARALRFKMKNEEWPFPWASVQIDRENASTHYASDIVEQIQRTVGLTVEATGQSPHYTVELGTNIKAGGNVEISDIDVSFPSGTVSDGPSGGNLQQFCDTLRQELRTRRIALLFMNTHEYSRAELVRIRRTIWDGALDGLIDHGLLLIDFSNPQEIPDLMLWPPNPCLAIELLDKYDDNARAAAHEDLTKIVFADGLVATPEEAWGFAEAILLTTYNIKDMYARLALCVVNPKAKR